MRRDKEEWLKQKIEDDLEAMADEREKLLMELEELQDIHMPAEKLEEIHREIEARKRVRPKVRVRLKAVLVAAAAMVLVIGLGIASSGSKLYVPNILQRNVGNEVTTKVNNVDAVESQYGNEYGEEEVCQEIEEKLGLIAPRLIYKPEGMALIDYDINEEDNEAIMKYEYDECRIHIYISRYFGDSLINFQTDGELLDTVLMESCGLEIPVYKYQNQETEDYFMVSFDYMNTCYFISGMIEQSEFEKILENILIKNI